MKQKLTAALLALACLFSLAACGKKDADPAGYTLEALDLMTKEGAFSEELEELDAEKDKRFSSYRPMVYALVAVCVLLVCALIAYMIFDASVKDAGLFQSTGTSIFVAALAPLILATLVVAGIAVRSDVAMWQEKK